MRASGGKVRKLCARTQEPFRKFFLVFRFRAIYVILNKAILSNLERKSIMRSNRMKNTSPPRRKRSAIKRVKPPRGTLPLLIVLCVAVVLLIFFAPKT